MLTGVHSSRLDEYWGDVEPFVQKAINEGCHDCSVEHVFDAIKNKDMQLWVWTQDGKVTAAAITSIVVYPLKKVCLIQFAGGSAMQDWKDDPLIDDWARHYGCTEIEIYGRRGWGRALKGFKEVFTHFRKRL